jgi:hypothetical protein
MRCGSSLGQKRTGKLGFSLTSHHQQGRLWVATLKLQGPIQAIPASSTKDRYPVNPVRKLGGK